jgi:hypothetical protein
MRKTIMRDTLLGATLAVAATLLFPATPARAQPVADFYRGKTLRMLIGYGPGGGYDIYGRLVAEFLPRHLPGNPTIVAQNMPGAGSFVAAKYIYDVAPKDGTVFGSLAQTLALDSMTNTNAKLDVAKMPYIGRVVTNIDTGAALPKTGSNRSKTCARNNTMSARPAAAPPRSVPDRAQHICGGEVQARPRLQRHDRYIARDGKRRGRYCRRLRPSRHAGEPPRLGAAR